MGSVGRLTTAVGSAIGALTSVIMMMVIGMFLAAEPKIYDRGIAWMLPLRHRDGFYRIADHVGFTLRRLAVRAAGRDAVRRRLHLPHAVARRGADGGAARPRHRRPRLHPQYRRDHLGHIDGRGRLFSAGTETGLWAIFVYFFVQNIDGYLVVPYIARRTVDLAPALVLAMQLLMGALFGILGVLFADPILATLKVMLVDLSEKRAAKAARRVRSLAARRPAGCALLLLHLLAHHRGAAADDLPHPDVEGQVAVLGKARRASRRRRKARLGGMVKRYSPPSRIRAIASAKPGKTWSAVNGCGAAMRFARIEHGAVVGGQDIIEQGRVGGRDRLAGAFLDGPELEARIGDVGAHRARAGPGEADAGGDDQQEGEATA